MNLGKIDRSLNIKCPRCGSDNIVVYLTESFSLELKTGEVNTSNQEYEFYCNDCGYTFFEFENDEDLNWDIIYRACMGEHLFHYNDWPWLKKYFCDPMSYKSLISILRYFLKLEK